MAIKKKATVIETIPKNSAAEHGIASWKTLIEGKEGRNVLDYEVMLIVGLKNAREDLKALKKKEEDLKERVMAIAGKYPNCCTVTQNKDVVKVNWEGIARAIAEEQFGTEAETVLGSWMELNTETKPGAVQLKINI